MLKKQIILYKRKREEGEEKRSVYMAQICKIIIYNYIF